MIRRGKLVRQLVDQHSSRLGIARCRIRPPAQLENRREVRETAICRIWICPEYCAPLGELDRHDFEDEVVKDVWTESIAVLLNRYNKAFNSKHRNRHWPLPTSII